MFSKNGKRVNCLKMHALVQFDNDEYAVMPSKRIKIVQGENCIVKYPGGAKYNATIKHSSDSLSILSELKKKLINNNFEKIQSLSKNLDDDPATCELSSKGRNILEEQTPDPELDKNGIKEDENLQSLSDSRVVAKKLKDTLIDDNSLKTLGENLDDNPSGSGMSKVKNVLQKGSQNSKTDDNMKRKADHLHDAFDFQGVTKKIKKELIDDYLSRTSDEKLNDKSSERELSGLKKNLQNKSQDLKMNETYIANKQRSQTFDFDISREKNDNDLGSSLGIISDETELNKAINLTDEESLAVCFKISNNSIPGIGFSTPINGSIILDLDVPVLVPKDISDILAQDRSIDSSLPPSGLTDQLEVLGPNWPDVSSQNNSACSQNDSDVPRSPKITASDNRSDELLGDFEDQKNDDSCGKDKCFLNVNSNNEDRDDSAKKDESGQNTTNVSSSGTDQSTHDPTYEPSAMSSATENIAVEEKSSIKVKSSSLDDLPAIDVRKVTIPTKVSDKGDSKKHFCIFCKTLQTKVVRHFIKKYADEEEVKKFKYLPPKHAIRKATIERLRKKGDFLHNNDKTYNTGILITSRRRSKKSMKGADDYTVCSSCKGYYAKSTIRFHYRRCCKSHQKRAKDILSSGRRLTGYIHDVASSKLQREIFPVLRDDDIVKCIRYDEIIIKMGNKLCEKYALVHQHDHIRAQLRLIGRLKLELMEISSSFEDFKNVFKPENFDKVIIALKIVADWNPSTMLYNIPSNAQTLTTLIRKFAKKLRVEYVKENDEEQQKAVDNFLLLWDEEVPTLINKKAREDQIEKKREKKITLPAKSDIKLLYDHLKKECSHCLNILDKKFDKDAWKLLNQATLISIQIFNRRRPGELERLKLISFTNKQTLADNLDTSQYENLSETSLNFAKQFVRLVLRGKLNREVSILLSPFDVECIEILISFRDQAGVSPDNIYLFANINTNKLSKEYIRACPLMCRFANECGAIVPGSLRGTNLRKHIATHTAMLNVKETEVDRLAHFMGHSKEIHKNIYRIPVPVAEMTTVSHMLTSALGSDNQLDNEEDDESSSEEENSDSSDEEHNVDDSNLNNVSINNAQNTSKERKSHTFSTSARNKWTEDEKYAIYEEFGDLLKLSKLPSLKQCTGAINKYKVLKQRTPQQVKTWIDNQRRAESRQKLYKSKKKSF